MAVSMLNVSRSQLALSRHASESGCTYAVILTVVPGRTSLPEPSVPAQPAARPAANSPTTATTLTQSFKALGVAALPAVAIASLRREPAVAEHRPQRRVLHAATKHRLRR